jgi:hypothetical protein
MMVMPGLVPASRLGATVPLLGEIAGTSPAMTKERNRNSDIAVYP